MWRLALRRCAFLFFCEPFGFLLSLHVGGSFRALPLFVFLFLLQQLSLLNLIPFHVPGDKVDSASGYDKENRVGWPVSEPFFNIIDTDQINAMLIPIPT